MKMMMMAAVLSLFLLQMSSSEEPTDPLLLKIRIPPRVACTSSQTAFYDAAIQSCVDIDRSIEIPPVAEDCPPESVKGGDDFCVKPPGVSYELSPTLTCPGEYRVNREGLCVKGVSYRSLQNRQKCPEGFTFRKRGQNRQPVCFQYQESQPPCSRGGEEVFVDGQWVCRTYIALPAASSDICKNGDFPSSNLNNMCLHLSVREAERNCPFPEAQFLDVSGLCVSPILPLEGKTRCPNFEDYQLEGRDNRLHCHPKIYSPPLRDCRGLEGFTLRKVSGTDDNGGEELWLCEFEFDGSKWTDGSNFPSRRDKMDTRIIHRGQTREDFITATSAPVYSFPGASGQGQTIPPYFFANREDAITSYQEVTVLPNRIYASLFKSPLDPDESFYLLLNEEQDGEQDEGDGLGDFFFH